MKIVEVGPRDGLQNEKVDFGVSVKPYLYLWVPLFTITALGKP